MAMPVSSSLPQLEIDNQHQLGKTLENIGGIQNLRELQESVSNFDDKNLNEQEKEADLDGPSESQSNRRSTKIKSVMKNIRSYQSNPKMSRERLESVLMKAKLINDEREASADDDKKSTVETSMELQQDSKDDQNTPEINDHRIKKSKNQKRFSASTLNNFADTYPKLKPEENYLCQKSSYLINRVLTAKTIVENCNCKASSTAIRRAVTSYNAGESCTCKESSTINFRRTVDGFQSLKQKSMKKSRTERTPDNYLCDSFASCLNCQNPADQNQSIMKRTTVLSMMTHASTAPSHYSNCQSMEFCQKCNNLLSKSSRSLHQLPASVSVALRHSKMSRSSARPSSTRQQAEASCDSFDACQNCAKSVRTSTRPSAKRNQAEASCDSFKACENCHRLKSNSKPFLVSSGCMSFGVCSACTPRKIIEPNSKLCQSASICRHQASQATRKSLSISSKAHLCDSFNFCDLCRKPEVGIKNRSLSSRQSKSVVKPCVNFNEVSEATGEINEKTGACLPSTLADFTSDYDKSDACQVDQTCSKISDCKSFLQCGACANFRSQINQSYADPEAIEECKSFNVCDNCADYTNSLLQRSMNEIKPSQSQMKRSQDPEMSRPSTGRQSKPQSRSKTVVKAGTMKFSDTAASAEDGLENVEPSNSKDEKENGEDRQPCGTRKSFDATGKTLFYLKPKTQTNELDCQPNPCESFEIAREVANDRKKASDTRRKLTAKKFSEYLEDEPEPNETEPVDECINQKNKPESSKKGEGLSKEFQKKKYEIEYQNYLIDKMNRELHTKTPNCRPEREMSQLQYRLGQEVKKLREMVQYAIYKQRRNHSEKWGPIPISPIVEGQAGSFEKTSKLKPPQTPSGISLVSGFSQIEESLIDIEKEKFLKQILDKEKQEKVQELCKEVQEIACQIKELQMAQKGSKVTSKVSQNILDIQPAISKTSPSDVNCQLKAVDDSINHLLNDVEAIKSNVKKLREKFNKSKLKL